MLRRVLVSAAVLCLAACHPRGEASSRGLASAAAESRPTASASAVAVTSATPSARPWPAIPVLDANRAPAKPGAYPSGSKDKRLVVFAASWCGGCVASVPGDAELARRYAGRIEVAVAIQEENDSFVKSAMARWLSDVRVYDERSTGAIAESCHVRAIPAACLLDGDRVLWTGSPGDAVAVLDAFLAGKLDDVLAKQEHADTLWRTALEHPDARPEAVGALHGFAGQENSVAWDLVDKKTPSANELALGVALAGDAVDATGALDFAILDTYALALSKAGDDAEAARVAKRVIDVCQAVQGECVEERERAEKLIARAR